MLKWLKKLLKQLWSLFKKLLPFIILAGVALFFLNPALFATIVATAGSWIAAIPGLFSSAFTWVTGLFEGLSFWEGVAAVAGAAFLLDPEGTTAALTDVASTVGGVVADVAGSVATSFLSSPVFWVAGGIALLYFMSGDSKDEEPPQSSVTITDLRPDIDYSPQKGLP